MWVCWEYRRRDWVCSGCTGSGRVHFPAYTSGSTVVSSSPPNGTVSPWYSWIHPGRTSHPHLLHFTFSSPSCETLWIFIWGRDGTWSTRRDPTPNSRGPRSRRRRHVSRFTVDEVWQ